MTDCTAVRRGEVPGAVIDTWSLDLADLSSVRAAAEQWLDSGRPLDVLINNAGGEPATVSSRPALGIMLQQARPMCMQVCGVRAAVNMCTTGSWHGPDCASADCPPGMLQPGGEAVCGVGGWQEVT